jgi:hypothetical protein
MPRIITTLVIGMLIAAATIAVTPASSADDARAECSLAPTDGPVSKLVQD